MFKPGWLAILFIFILIGVILVGLSRLEFDRELTTISSNKVELLPFYKDLSLNQSFVSAANNLSSIGVMLHNYYPSRAGQFKISLVDDQGQLIASRSSNLMALISPRFFNLNFEPFTASAGKSFSIKLETDAPKNFPLTIFLSENKDSRNQLYINNDKLDKELYFLSTYKNSNPQKLGLKNLNLVVKRISQYRPVIFKGNFLLILVSIYLLACCLYLYFFIKDGF